MITFTGKGILGLATYSHSGTQPVNQPPTGKSRQPSIGGGNPFFRSSSLKSTTFEANKTNKLIFPEEIFQLPFCNHLLYTFLPYDVPPEPMTAHRKIYT